MSRRFEVDTKTFVRFWLVILGFGLLGWFIWRARTGLIIVGIAAFLAIAIWPLAKMINQHFKKDRQGLAAVLAYLVVFAVLGFALAVVGPVVVNETARFIGQVPEMFQSTVGGWEGLDRLGAVFGMTDLGAGIFQELQKVSTSLLGGAGDLVVNGVGMVANLLTGTILVLALTLLFLLQGPALAERFWRWLEKAKLRRVADWRRTTNRMRGVIATYVLKQVMVALLDGTVVALMVFVLALVFKFSVGLALPMGLIAMVLYLIPMFGPIIACVMIALILCFSNPLAGVILAVAYVAYLQVESNLIAPKIQGNALQLPPLVILAAITIGMYMFGLIGAIVAIPIAGCGKVLIEEWPKLREGN